MLLYEALLFEPPKPATPAESSTSRQSFPAHPQPIDTQALPHSAKNDGVYPLRISNSEDQNEPANFTATRPAVGSLVLPPPLPVRQTLSLSRLENLLFCARHSQPHYMPTPIPEVDLSDHFGPEPLNFRSASELNDFLCSLAHLMIENRISARRASVLAYIASLELRTLPAIEHELGSDAYEEMPRLVFDPPEPVEIPAPSESSHEIRP